MIKQPTRQEIEAVVERIGGVKEIFACRVKNGVSKPFKVIGTVYIGTVLEKMKEQNILYANAPDPRGDDNAGWILDYWSKCGFSRSLQEIILESEWSHSAHAKVCNVGHEEVLTSPEANALFSFLQEI